jgi:hypothetical protein
VRERERERERQKHRDRACVREREREKDWKSNKKRFLVEINWAIRKDTSHPTHQQLNKRQFITTPPKSFPLMGYTHPPLGPSLSIPYLELLSSDG